MCTRFILIIKFGVIGELCLRFIWSMRIYRILQRCQRLSILASKPKTARVANPRSASFHLLTDYRFSYNVPVIERFWPQRLTISRRVLLWLDANGIVRHFMYAYGEVRESTGRVLRPQVPARSSHATGQTGKEGP